MRMKMRVNRTQAHVDMAEKQSWLRGQQVKEEEEEEEEAQAIGCCCCGWRSSTQYDGSYHLRELVAVAQTRE